jgi:hypothetical protein
MASGRPLARISGGMGQGEAAGRSWHRAKAAWGTGGPDVLEIAPFAVLGASPGAPELSVGHC